MMLLVKIITAAILFFIIVAPPYGIDEAPSILALKTLFSF